MNDTEKLIHDLRQLGKYSELEPNWLLVAADKIEELSKRVEVVRCKDCIYFQPDFVLTNDGERRPYTQEEKKVVLVM